VVHAEGDARAPEVREELSRAAVRVERARGRLRRRDPEASLALWTALVGERYSLVERIDSDGRRLLEARDNPCRPFAPSPLSERERHVLAYRAMGHANKLVAYELGLSPSAVATYAVRIRRKLGAASRVELVRLVARRSAISAFESPSRRSAPSPIRWPRCSPRWASPRAPSWSRGCSTALD
jgi:DNA-binding CsgD family transcriptional regulator